MTTPIVHDHKIRNRQRIPLGRVHWFECSCGAKSPEAVDRDVAVIAQRAHVREVGHV